MSTCFAFHLPDGRTRRALSLSFGLSKDRLSGQPFKRPARVFPSSDGLGETRIPAASIAAILLSAPPWPPETIAPAWPMRCLLYTSDAADERSSVDLGGRR